MAGGEALLAISGGLYVFESASIKLAPSVFFTDGTKLKNKTRICHFGLHGFKLNCFVSRSL